jgi:hypothetical protein
LQLTASIFCKTIAGGIYAPGPKLANDSVSVGMGGYRRTRRFDELTGKFTGCRNSRRSLIFNALLLTKKLIKIIQNLNDIQIVTCLYLGKSYDTHAVFLHLGRLKACCQLAVP